MWQGWLNLLLGAWIAVAPFTSLDVPWSRLNDICFGVVAVYVSGTIPVNKVWPAWLGIIAGIWVVISTYFKIFMIGEGYIWSNVISGMAILIAGVLALARIPKRSLAE